MKITDYAVMLQGDSQKESYEKTVEKRLVETKIVSVPLAEETETEADKPNSQPMTQAVILQLSEQAKKAQELQTAGVGIGNNKEFEDSKLDILEKFLELWTGKKFKFHRFRMPQLNNNPIDIGRIADAQMGRPAVQNMSVTRTVADWSYERYESEKMNFKAQAVVNTADGRSITIDLELNMSRELYEKSSMHFEWETAAKLIDPLVINYGASSADLSSTKFSFDLDCDGTSDQISQLLSGSGFLALDKNKDGIINDGSELFGTKSGDGFADLAQYDQDGNGWIDESDEIFNSLRIWSKDENGGDVLLALGEVGIGALYLGSADTLYSLKDGWDENGQIRKTGIFLFEDGRAGTMQHVDLRV